MKNIFKSKRNILIMMFALVVIMGIGFAAYSQQLRINDTSSIDSNWNVYIKDVRVPSKTSGATGSGTVDEVEKLKAELTTDLKYPGDYVIYNITVANDGTIDAILEKINFSMEKEDTVINYYYSVDDQSTWNKVTKNGENPYNEDLLANTTDEFQVKVEYDPTKTGTATNDQKSNKLTLNLDYAQKTGGGAVVPSNTASFGGQTVTLAEAGSDGLYEDEYESTEDAKKYVYKGANPDNYITFNEENDGIAGWRILSVETDGTIKIMKKDSIGMLAFNTSRFNTWDNSSIDIYLNDTYYNSLSITSRQLIISHNFGVGGVPSAGTAMSAQITNENKVITNRKIALMSLSEFIRANSNIEQCGDKTALMNNSFACKDTNYIGNGLSGSVWTLTPYFANLKSVYTARLDGFSFEESDYQSIDVLPSIYLNPNITLSGTGTMDDPYTINS